MEAPIDFDQGSNYYFFSALILICNSLVTDAVVVADGEVAEAVTGSGSMRDECKDADDEMLWHCCPAMTMLTTWTRPSQTTLST